MKYFIYYSQLKDSNTIDLTNLTPQLNLDENNL